MVKEISPVTFKIHWQHYTMPKEWTDLKVYLYSGLHGQKKASEYLGHIKQPDKFDLNTVGPAYLKSGTKIKIKPEMPGFRFAPGETIVSWYEDWIPVVFRMMTDLEGPLPKSGKKVKGKVSFFVGPLPINEIDINVIIKEHLSGEEKFTRNIKEKPVYRKIFLSYAHKDSEIVAKIEAAFKAFLDEDMRDVVTLRSGEKWKPAINNLIKEADVFLLYWSYASRESPHVKKEWKEALKQDKEDFIRPVYWEVPMPEPPPELAKIHFCNVKETIPMSVSSQDKIKETVEKRSPVTFRDHKQELKRKYDALLDSNLFKPGKSVQIPPDEEVDPVDCTLFSPPTVPRGEILFIQVFIHTPGQKKKVKNQAKKFDDETTERGFTRLTTLIEKGSILTFKLSIHSFKTKDLVKELTWNSRPEVAQFLVNIPGTYKGKKVIGTVHVNQNSFPIGEITFKIKIVPADQIEKEELIPTGDVSQYKKYFISYASKDRPKVIPYIQALQALGRKFFLDVIDLKAADKWQDKLYEQIDECDAVFLLWSTNAKNSEWVMKECRYTIKKKGIERLIPIPIEGPPPVEPPPELKELHMNDKLLYFLEKTATKELRA